MATQPFRYYIYTLDPATCASLICDLPHFTWLKSNGSSQDGRFDILSAAPSLVLKSSPTEIPIKPNDIPPEIAHLPFLVGWIGAALYEHGDYGANNNEDNAQSYFGYYDWSYCYDHQERRGWLILSANCSAELVDKLLSTIEGIPSQLPPKGYVDSFSELAWRKSQSANSYNTAFDKIQQYINAGDCYQVNLTQRFEATHTLSPHEQLSLFTQQAEQSSANFGAYLRLNDKSTLLSFSPERFLSISNRKVSTSPIKGTVRNAGSLSDETVAELLNNKNKAENLMIVDLLRNDLSKSCELHSVKVDKLFEVQSFENVHHLVSTISGRLREGVTAIDALWNAFPGGSITGAPKIRAMQIINELEAHQRSFYCGSVFYWDIRGNLDSNILIRTLLACQNRIYCWGGGGIVSDSIMEAEYQESIDKVRHLTGIEE